MLNLPLLGEDWGCSKLTQPLSVFPAVLLSLVSAEHLLLLSLLQLWLSGQWGRVSMGTGGHQGPCEILGVQVLAILDAALLRRDGGLGSSLAPVSWAV